MRGFGIYALPFSSGHVLALRVFPESDFGPYTSIWHRDPEGAWSIYVDGVALEQACPRYFGACADSRPARIAIEWRGPRKLRVLMDEPALDWDVSMGSSLLFAAMNLVAPLIPERLYRRPLMLGLFARAARRWFGMGDIDLLGTVPNGQLGILLPGGCSRSSPRARCSAARTSASRCARGRIPPSEPCVCPPGVRLGHGVLRRCAVMTRATSPEAKPTPAEPRLPAPGTPSRSHWAVLAICALPNEGGQFEPGVPLQVSRHFRLLKMPAGGYFSAAFLLGSSDGFTYVMPQGPTPCSWMMVWPFAIP